jgi:SAM-dependent methyltransferase
MNKIRADEALLLRLKSDPSLQVKDVHEFAEKYDDLATRFHSHFPEYMTANSVANANYHKWRYLALFEEKLGRKVLDVGNDKPFLTFYLEMLFPNSVFQTTSFEIPTTPFDLYCVDIETEDLPQPPGSIDHVLFTEVLEHLWRDPARAIFQLNRVLRLGGEIYITTPNPCELHAILCILWQANPNQRNQFYRTLESGHLHLWSSADLRILLESNGFGIRTIGSFDAYKYTQHDKKLLEFVREMSPHVDLMGESLVVRANKIREMHSPFYHAHLFPDGVPVQCEGTVALFQRSSITTQRRADAG